MYSLQFSAIIWLSDSWRALVMNYSHIEIELFGTLIIQFLFFWIPSIIYTSLDYIAPQFSEAHKLQPAPKQPTAKDIRQCVIVVIQNQIMTIIIQLLVMMAASRAGQPSAYRIESSLPTLTEMARDFILNLLIREVLFYYSHRILHHPRIYAYIHKKHHRFTAPVALAAQYAHPVEHIVANVLPIALPPQLLRSHILTFWIFLAFELVETSSVHSGYDFFAGQARMHDLHHEKFVVNFGALGFLDRLHGTDKMKKKEGRAE